MLAVWPSPCSPKVQTLLYNVIGIRSAFLWIPLGIVNKPYGFLNFPRVQTLLQKLLEKFIETEDLDELGRARLAIRIAEAEDRMNDGADEYLQLMTVCGLALQCLFAAGQKMKQ